VSFVRASKVLKIQYVEVWLKLQARSPCVAEAQLGDVHRLQWGSSLASGTGVIPGGGV
jgi:hypothetical protein